MAAGICAALCNVRWPRKFRCLEILNDDPEDPFEIPVADEDHLEVHFADEMKQLEIQKLEKEHDALSDRAYNAVRNTNLLWNESSLYGAQTRFAHDTHLNRFNQHLRWIHRLAGRCMSLRTQMANIHRIEQRLWNGRYVDEFQSVVRELTDLNQLPLFILLQYVKY